MKDAICMATCLIPVGFILLCFYGASKNASRDHKIKEQLLKKLEEER